MIWPLIKKYWKYGIILIVGAAALIFWIMISSWLKRNDTSGEGMTEGTETMKDVIGEIGNKMTEADQQASVEIAVARGKEGAKKEELQKVVKIKDKSERRKRMAAMYDSTR